MKTSKLIISLLLLPMLAFSQKPSDNYIAMGYGKPLGAFGHSFHLQYTKKYRNNLSWYARGQFYWEEQALGTSVIYDYDYKGNLLNVLPDQKFTLEGIINHDNVYLGTQQLVGRDLLDVYARLNLALGYHIPITKVFFVSVFGGGTFEYLSSQAMVVFDYYKITDKRFGEIETAMLQKAYHRGLNFGVSGNVVMGCMIKQKFLLGIDGIIHYYPHGGGTPVQISAIFGLKF